ncbi:MAG: ATP-binding protein, partial [Chloroflexota bacterium]
MLRFGDILSNALHDIKQHTGKKIGIVMDELGYGFDPELSGTAIESWRYRKGPPTLAHLETLARLIVGYGIEAHDRDWLATFLKSGGHPYPKAICDEVFSTAQPVAEAASTHQSFNPPPLKAYGAPLVAGFVGREADIARYKSQLGEQHFAVISGMAGIGKTSLMSVLANQWDGAVFWHSFGSGSLDSLVNRLAGFAANLERPELWDLLESARLGNSRPPAIDTVLEMLSVVLGELTDPVLLCLDDLQFVD